LGYRDKERWQSGVGGGSVLDMDPNLLAGYGSQEKNYFGSIRIGNNFEKNYSDKVIKFTVSHKKCTVEKNPIFSKKEIALKSLNLNKNLVYFLQKLISRHNSRIRIWIRLSQPDPSIIKQK
jgi:hypothetical protein